MYQHIEDIKDLTQQFAELPASATVGKGTSGEPAAAESDESGEAATFATASEAPDR